MAKKSMYFFTDIDRIDNTQSVDQAFGPDDITPNTVFQVGSTHSYTGAGAFGPNVYAVCSGTVVVRRVPATAPQELTIILKPSQQPDGNLPKIKFIVYRGVLESSLIYDNAGTDSILLDTDPNANDLTKSMQKSHSDRGGAAPVPDVALQAVIQQELLPSGVLETPQQAKLFRSFNASGSFDTSLDGPNQPPEVEAGNYIGRFNPASFGIEIIQENVGFEPDIAYAELVRKQVTSPAESKEAILPFLDPCAFYGSLVDHKVSVYSNSGLVGDNGAPSNEQKYTGDDIYDNILTPAFRNRNVLYVDIRNQYNYSCDYFQEYQGLVGGNPNANLKFSTIPGDLQNAFVGIDYDNFNGIQWPLLILTTTDFSATSNVDDQSEVRLSFPQGSFTDPNENINPVLYVAQGDIKSKFLRKTKQCSLPTFGGINNDGNFTKPITFEVPNSGNALGPISSYIRIKYSKQFSICPAPASSNAVIRSSEILDNVFRPFEMDVKDPMSNTDFQMRVYEDEIHVDALGFTGQSHFSYQGIARDTTGNVTFFAYTNKRVVKDDLISQPLPLTDMVAPTLSSFPDILVQNSIFANDFCLSAEDIIIGAAGGVGPVNPILPGIAQRPVVGLASSYAQYDANDIFWISFTQAEYAAITVAMQGAGFDNAWRGVHLGLVYRRAVISANSGLEYSEYDVVLRGYVGGVVAQVACPVLHYRRAMVPNPNPTLVGRGFTTTDDGPTNPFLEPDGQIAHLQNSTDQNIPTHTIKSVIYLVRGWNIGNAEFCQFLDYFRDNIKEVWDSNTNWGLGSVYLSVDNDDLGPEQGSGGPLGDFARSQLIHADDIEVKVATASQFQKLKRGECLFLVTKDANGARSYVNGNRKTGEMYYAVTQPDGVTTNNSTIPYVDVPNIPAHEFGHILGLADYYGYAAEVGRNLSTGNNNRDIVNPNGGGATGVYNGKLEGGVFDEEYGQRFNWVHNLMSTMRNVADVPTGALPLTPRGIDYIRRTETYRVYHEWYMPTLPGVLGANPKITVFVTPRQLQHILENDEQEGMESFVCFQDWNGNVSAFTGYLGTFTSPTIRPTGVPGEIILTDEEFRSDFNTALYDPLFNKFQHQMFYRAMKNSVAADLALPSPAGPQFADTYHSYMNPFLPNPHQTVNVPNNRNVLLQDEIIEPSQFDELNFVYPENGVIFMYDITVGGNAHSSRNGLRVCQNQINANLGPVVAVNPARLLIPTAPATLPVPAPDDVTAGWSTNNNLDDLGINGRRIWQVALWWVNEHVRILESANSAGNAVINGTFVPALTTYETSMIQFTRFNTTSIIDGGVVKLYTKRGSSNDKFNNVGWSNDTDTFNLHVPGRKWWNHSELNDSNHTNAPGPFANGGALIRDGNNGENLREFEPAGGNTPNNSGWDKRVTRVRWRLDFDYYPNRRTILKLVIDGCLGPNCNPYFSFYTGE
jgi:hypothetical protein